MVALAVLLREISTLNSVQSQENKRNSSRISKTVLSALVRCLLASVSVVRVLTAIKLIVSEK